VNVIVGDQMTAKTISVEEAAKILGIGRNSAYEAARNGQLPVIKIGKLLRIPVVALERMLEEARPNPQPRDGNAA
jgi:excisionase family DNA binding protein